MKKTMNEDVEKKIMHSCDNCLCTDEELFCRQCWEKEQESGFCRELEEEWKMKKEIIMQTEILTIIAEKIKTLYFLTAGLAVINMGLIAYLFIYN